MLRPPEMQRLFCHEIGYSLHTFTASIVANMKAPDTKQLVGGIHATATQMGFPIQKAAQALCGSTTCNCC